MFLINQWKQKTVGNFYTKDTKKQKLILFSGFYTLLISTVYLFFSIFTHYSIIFLCEIYTLSLYILFHFTKMIIDKTKCYVKNPCVWYIRFIILKKNSWIKRTLLWCNFFNEYFLNEWIFLVNKIEKHENISVVEKREINEREYNSQPTKNSRYIMTLFVN